MVSGHGCDHVGLDDKLSPACFEGLVNLFDVVNFVVNDGRRMIEIRPVGHAQHQANSTAIEKSHVGRSLKKVGHAEHIAIKGNRPVEVMHVDEDLADARKGRADWYWGRIRLMLDRKSTRLNSSHT